MDTEDLNRVNLELKHLFPLGRSLSNEAFDYTCQYIFRKLNYNKFEVTAGTKVCDWVVPKRWTPVEAYLKNGAGQVLVDLKNSNLHVVSYSKSIHKFLSKEELLKNLHFVESLPDAIPYRTSYYDESWGICLPYNVVNSPLFYGPFEVYIETEIEAGPLNWYEVEFGGSSDQWILISSYACHPSLANDNLSGVVTLGMLGDYISGLKSRKFNYRLVIVPETIGAIALINHLEPIDNYLAGFVMTSNAGPGHLGFKETYLGNHWLDLTTKRVLDQIDPAHERHMFDPFGSDERQYSGPFARIPMITIIKDKYHNYPQYHTSLDNLDFISAENLLLSLEVYKKIINDIETDIWPRRLNKSPGEFQLGRRGLYPKIGGALKTNGFKSYQSEIDLGSEDLLHCFSWIMFYSDGRVPLSFISQKSGIEISFLKKACEILKRSDLIEV